MAEVSRALVYSFLGVLECQNPRDNAELSLSEECVVPPAVEMPAIVHTPAKLRSRLRLQWWGWAKLFGAAGLVPLTIMLLTGQFPHPGVVAILLHLAGDFTFQSPETALRKEERRRHLLIHALVAGGLPLAIAGLAIGDPFAVLAWTALGVTSHYAVDWTRKFGLRRATVAVLLDQACHLLTILILVLKVC